MIRATERVSSVPAWGILTCALNEWIRDIGPVGRKEGSGIEGRVIQVRGRRISLEHVRSHGHIAGAGKRVGESEASRSAVLRWRLKVGKLSAGVQSVFGKVNSKHVRQVQDGATARVWGVGVWLGNIICR